MGGMKAAACLQGYYEEDQVTEEAMQLHHAMVLPDTPLSELSTLNSQSSDKYLAYACGKLTYRYHIVLRSSFSQLAATNVSSVKAFHFSSCCTISKRRGERRLPTTADNHHELF